MVPASTPALTRHSSFSRFGVPRERIWYELRMVDLHVWRQLKNVWANGSFRSILAFCRVKKPGRALLYSPANSGDATHDRNVLTSAACLVAVFMPMAMSVWSLM